MPSLSRTSRRPSLTVLVALVCLALASCSSPDDDRSEAEAGASQQLVDKRGVTAEYEATAAELEWPPGVTPPERPDDEEGGSYQVGVGATDAVMAWNCAWGREWLKVRDSDPAAAEHALHMYAAFLERPEFLQHFDPQSAQPVVRGIVEDAELGDPSGVQQDVSANCPEPAP